MVLRVLIGISAVPQSRKPSDLSRSFSKQCLVPVQNNAPFVSTTFSWFRVFVMAQEIAILNMGYADGQTVSTKV